MSKFILNSSYQPSQDQQNAIDVLSKSIQDNHQYQTLLGVTGSGKTFTMAKIIEKLQMPTLIMTHNKTLAAQLYSEFKGFFPQNHVEYFISYYDYYQPEAYIPRQDLFIEKDSSINSELERLRLSTTASLLSFEDVICVASVSANYGLGSPEEYKKMVQKFETATEYNQREILLKIVQMGYVRNDQAFDRANFRVNGDIIDIFPAYWEDNYVRLEFFGDELEDIVICEYLTNQKISHKNSFTLYAVNPFVLSEDKLPHAIKSIEEELEDRLRYFKENDKMVEYQRLQQRVEFDLEMLQSNGVCKGIENYSRHLTDKEEGQTPYSLIDYFEAMGRDYLIIVDESHVSLSQFRGMYAGDRSRKEILVEYGFRLPSALDNRPLKFEEYINKAPHYLFVSATPNDLELELSQTVAKQIIRPTGLLDPIIEVRDSQYQVENLFDEIKKTIANGNRVLITVLTKKMAQELSTYYLSLGLKVQYMHSDIDAIERNQIIRALRMGKYDVLIGINLLREGLDIPETELVAILDADKEGFLRSKTALIQTIGRAARNEKARVILYAKNITKSMQYAIDETNDRRKIQEEYNKQHNITPKSVKRTIDSNLKLEEYNEVSYKLDKTQKIPPSQKKQILKELKQKMTQAAKELNFEEAIRLRDEIEKIKKI